MGFTAVICFLYPHLLTIQDIRYGFYRENLFWIRPLLFAVLAIAYLLGITNLALRKNKTLGFTTLGTSSRPEMAVKYFRCPLFLKRFENTRR